MANEKDVIARLHNRDSTAITIFWKLYWNDLYAFGKQYPYNSDVIVDMITETFLVLCNKPPAVDSYNLIKAFLLVTLRNKILNQLKKDQRNAVHQKNYDYMITYQQDSKEDKALIEYYFRHIPSFIEKLPKRGKQVLELKIKGFTDDEIAQRLELKPPNVRVILSNARKTLQKMLNEGLNSNNDFIKSLIPFLIKLILLN